jgi:hypothetical protein
MAKTLYQLFEEEETRRRRELDEFVRWANEPPLKLERRREAQAEEAPIRAWFIEKYDEEIDQAVLEAITNQILYGHPEGLEARL